MIAQPIKHRNRIILGILSVALLIAGYSVLSAKRKAENPTDTVFPNAKQFVEGVRKVATKDYAGNRWITQDLAASGSRLGLGLLAGVSLSLLVGIGMGVHFGFAAMVQPPLAFLSKVPPTAMLAIYFVLFGTHMELFVAIIGFGIFPTMALAIFGAVKKDVPQELIHKAYTLGASHMETVLEVVFMQVLPRIIQTLELSIGPAMVLLIAAEWVMADIGFGYRLRMQARLLNMNVVYLYLIFLGSAGYLIDFGLRVLRRRLCPWFGE
jgi:NitT/TauT family transport system permease protein